MILKCFCVTAQSFWCELHTANICLKTMSWSYWYEQHTVNIFSGRCCGLVGTRTLLQIFVLPQCCDLINASNKPFYMLTLIKKELSSLKWENLKVLKLKKVKCSGLKKKSSSSFYPRVLNFLKIGRTIKSPT